MQSIHHVAIIVLQVQNKITFSNLSKSATALIIGKAFPSGVVVLSILCATILGHQLQLCTNHGPISLAYLHSEVADVPSGALRIIGRGRFLQFVAVRQGTVFGAAAVITS